MFQASAKRYDPDVYEVSPLYTSLGSAVSWCQRFASYGFSSFWVEDKATGLEKKIENVTQDEICKNKLNAA